MHVAGILRFFLSAEPVEARIDDFEYIKTVILRMSGLQKPQYICHMPWVVNVCMLQVYCGFFLSAEPVEARIDDFKYIKPVSIISN